MRKFRKILPLTGERKTCFMSIDEIARILAGGPPSL